MIFDHRIYEDNKILNDPHPSIHLGTPADDRCPPSQPINISPYPIAICVAVANCGQWQYVPGAGTQQFYTFAHFHYYVLLSFTYYHIMILVRIFFSMSTTHNILSILDMHLEDDFLICYIWILFQCLASCEVNGN